jgi:hypothetical protein
MRLVLLIFLIPIFLFLLALAMLWVPLPAPLPVVSSSGRNLLAAVCTGVVGLVLLGGVAVYTVNYIRRAGHWLDRVFPSPAYTFRPFMVAGRQYQGAEQGRRVEANYIPAARVQPALLNLYVDAESKISAAIGTKRPIMDCRDCPRVENLGCDLDELLIYSADPEWIRRYLDNSTIRNIIIDMLVEKGPGMRELYIQPDKIWLRSHPSSGISAEQVRRWCSDLLELAKMAEAVIR